MIMALHLYLSDEPAIIGIGEPESHKHYRETGQIMRVNNENRSKVSVFIPGKELDASIDVDNEKNAVRLVEQVVREAFRRFREQKSK
jgi:hypothetical protein